MLELLQILYPNAQIEVVDFETPMKPCVLRCGHCEKTYEYKKACQAKNKINFCSCFSDFQSGREKIYYLSKIFQYEVLDDKDLNDITCQCNRCGRIWKTTSGVLTKGGECKCHNKQGLTREQFQQRVDNKFGLDSYCILDYEKWGQKIHIKHNKCGFIWKQTPGHFIEGCGCPKCFRKRSKGEIEIESFLTQNNIEFKSQFCIEKEEEYFYCDFYLPQQNLVIEYQGEQHYHPVKNFGGEKGYLRTTERDEHKRKLLQNKKMELLEIPYWELKNISNILSSKLNDYPNREYNQAIGSGKEKDIV